MAVVVLVNYADLQIKREVAPPENQNTGRLRFKFFDAVLLVGRYTSKPRHLYGRYITCLVGAASFPDDFFRVRNGLLWSVFVDLYIYSKRIRIRCFHGGRSPGIRAALE